MCHDDALNGASGNEYSFPVVLPTDDDGLAVPVRGDAARTIFDENRVAKIFWRGSCH